MTPLNGTWDISVETIDEISLIGVSNGEKKSLLKHKIIETMYWLINSKYRVSLKKIDYYFELLFWKHVLALSIINRKYKYLSLQTKIFFYSNVIKKTCSTRRHDNRTLAIRLQKYITLCWFPSFLGLNTRQKRLKILNNNKLMIFY